MDVHEYQLEVETCALLREVIADEDEAMLDHYLGVVVQSSLKSLWVHANYGAETRTHHSGQKRDDDEEIRSRIRHTSRDKTLVLTGANTLIRPNVLSQAEWDKWFFGVRENE